MDRFHGNGPIRVFLSWSEAGKFKICHQNSKKKSVKKKPKISEEAKNIEIFPNFKDRWRRRTFLSASHRKCISL